MSEHAQRLLLRWHARARRGLPWRRPPGQRPPGYVVLVSETMLQQTRVETVIDYFNRWMARWPGLAQLAAAEPDEVLALWSGLGYYRRARNLHATARLLCERHAGQVPVDPTALAALPGVGPYTVGALLSIALGKPAALVDGNVARVLSRWFALEAPVASSGGRKALWRLAGQLVHSEPAKAAPGAWNESLMELGALICRPKRSDCAVCPLVDSCQAFAGDRQDSLPTPTVRRPPRPVAATALIALHKAQQGEVRVLLGQRPETGRWPGLWQPPMLEGPDAPSLMAQRLQTTLPTGAKAQANRSLPVLVHVLTHRRYQVEPWLVQIDQPAMGAALAGPEHVAWRWMPLHTALQRGQGLSRLAVRLLEAIGPNP